MRWIALAALLLIGCSDSPTKPDPSPLAGISAHRHTVGLLDSALPVEFLIRVSFTEDSYDRRVSVPSQSRDLAITSGTYQINECRGGECIIQWERLDGTWFDFGTEEWEPASGSVWTSSVLVGQHYLKIDGDLYEIE